MITWERSGKGSDRGGICRHKVSVGSEKKSGTGRTSGAGEVSRGGEDGMERKRASGAGKSPAMSDCREGEGVRGGVSCPNTRLGDGWSAIYTERRPCRVYRRDTDLARSTGSDDSTPF